MIIDALNRMGRYVDAIPHLAEGLACLAAHKDETEPARYAFAGGFMMLQKGATRSVQDGDYEAHRRYLDVQVLLDGAETVEWASAETLTETVAYDESKDKVMYAGKGSLVEICPGMCYVCWPCDAHKACRNTGTLTTYRKAVIKLELE